MSSAIKHYVHIQGVFDDYVSIKAVDVGGTIEDFIELILKEKQSKLSAHFNVDIDAGEVKLYYQGSDIKSKTTVETLAGHWQKLSEFIKPGQQTAFFRMEIVSAQSFHVELNPILKRLQAPVIDVSSPTGNYENSGIVTGIFVVNLDAPLSFNDRSSSRSSSYEASVSFSSSVDLVPVNHISTVIDGGFKSPYRVASSYQAHKILTESSFYSSLSIIRPPWSSLLEGAQSVRSMYGRGLSAVFPKISNAKPELKIRSNVPFSPAFNAELKSAGDLRLFEGATLYTALEMFRNYFETWGSGVQKVASTSPASSPSDEAILMSPKPIVKATSRASSPLARGFSPSPRAMLPNTASLAASPSSKDSLESLSSLNATIGIDMKDIHRWRFFPRPPLGFAICGTAPVAWLCQMELAGRFFLTAMTQPFFIGSSEHRSAIASLNDMGDNSEINYMKKNMIDIEKLGNLEIWGQKVGSEKTLLNVWYSIRPIHAKEVTHHGDVKDFTIGDLTSTSGFFFKIMYWNATSASHIKRRVLAFKAYRNAFENASSINAFPPPASLLPTQLWFGCAMLAVVMPFVSNGREARETELDEAGDVADKVAEAILWLAHHDMYHSDVRNPNVIVVDADDNKRNVYLVDYDDLRVIPGLGDKLRDEGGANFLSTLHLIDDGSQVSGDTPLTKYNGVWQAIERQIHDRVSKRARQN